MFWDKHDAEKTIFTSVGQYWEPFSMTILKSFEHKANFEDSSLLVRPLTAIPCLIE